MYNYIILDYIIIIYLDILYNNYKIYLRKLLINAKLGFARQQ